MTLCVAAECKRHKRFFSAVVFATDMKIEGEMASADIGRKLVCCGEESYPILMAGTQTRALSLATEIARALFEFHKDPSSVGAVVPWEAILRSAVLQDKYLIAHEIVSSRFGISYEEFLKIGKSTFPEEIHRDTVNEISRAQLDCWLLVLSFAHNEARIYRISGSGTIETCEHFAAIGSGYYIAEASLYQRSQSVENDLGTTIYNVYEAMRLGSIAPGVSDKFEIGVAEWDWFEQPNPDNQGEVKISFLQPSYYDYLAAKFKRFGPQPIEKIKIRPRLIKERWRALVLTPKGEMDPETKKRSERAKVAREREARKRAARETASQKSNSSKTEE